MAATLQEVKLQTLDCTPSSCSPQCLSVGTDDQPIVPMRKTVPRTS